MSAQRSESRVVPIPHTTERLETIIWDFNGTLIDDVDLVVRSVNVQLAKRGLPELTAKRYRGVFGFPVEAYYRRIGLDPEVESMSELSAEFHDAYSPGLMDCPLHHGVLDVLVQFRESGIRQFVLSAMEERLLHSALELLEIAGFFDAVYGLAHSEADSKISRGRELLAKYRIRPETALLIGDTDHDAEVADALGVSVILIAQGHQSEAKLQRTGHPIYRSVRAWVEAHRMGDADSTVSHC